MVSVTFLLTSLVVIMTPGPDLALITHLVVKHGRRRPALAAAAGMVSAGAMQVVLGFAGLAVLLSTNPALFDWVRWAGAATLVTWGLLAARAGLRPPSQLPTDMPRVGRTYWLGFACTGTNPKVGVFLVAFLPQFAAPLVSDGPPVAVLAVLYLGMGLCWLVIWTALVQRLSPLLLGPRVRRAASWVIGAVFVALGIRLALLG